MPSAVPQHYHSPHRDHQNQHTEKCSVHTRRCLAIQCTLISCSSRSFCSTGLSVTSPHLHSENIFIPLHDSRTTYIVSSILVCFFWDFCNSSPFCFSQHLPQPSALRAQPWLLLYSWRWLISLFTWPLPLSSVHHVWLPLWHPVLNISFFTHVVSPLHFQHHFCYSVTQPFGIGAFIDFSCCFLFCNYISIKYIHYFPSNG